MGADLSPHNITYGEVAPGAMLTRGRGRPKRQVDVQRVAELRASGHSWRAIAAQLGVSVRTVRRVALRNSATLLPQGVGAGQDARRRWDGYFEMRP
jgi:DNA invertase Pin-like site-specific DNA recombinase